MSRDSVTVRAYPAFLFLLVIPALPDLSFFLFLPQALRQLGATQMLLDGAMDDAETSLLRAARLGSSGADQGKVINHEYPLHTSLLPFYISSSRSYTLLKNALQLDTVIATKVYLCCIVTVALSCVYSQANRHHLLKRGTQLIARRASQFWPRSTRLRGTTTGLRRPSIYGTRRAPQPKRP